MKVITDNGKLSLLTDDGIYIDNITAHAENNGEHYDILTRCSGSWRILSESENRVSVSDGVFSLEITGTGAATLVKGRFSPNEKINGLIKVCFFKGRSNIAFDKAYLNGFTMFNGVRVHEMQAPVGVSRLMGGEYRESMDFAVAEGVGCVLFGAVEFKENVTLTEVCADGSFALCGLRESQPFARGDEIRSDTFVIKKYENFNGALCGYAALAEMYNSERAVTLKRAVIGWCSWYYYGPGITERIILDNLAEIKKRKVPVNYIQIDDGWSLSRGDWEPNAKFPHGMKWLADRIKEEGFIPGIWVAPFTAENGSGLLSEHPEFFVKSFESDEIYGWNTLDFSNEKACGYLYELFYKLSHEWGYRYIKIDFMAYGMSAGRYNDANFNALKNYRRAAEIIKSAVTEDTYLLACTSPLLPAIGQFDALRTSMDMFERWGSLKSVAKQVFLRSYLNEKIRTDPDCVMLRTAENEDGECFRKCTRNSKEIETYLSFAAVSGGIIMLSDKVILLKDEQLEKFSYLSPVNQRAGIPVDINENDIPAVIDCGIQGNIRTVALFNWGDYPKEIIFELAGKYGVFDFWERMYLGIADKLNFVIEPHGCKILHCTPIGSKVLGAFHRIVPAFKTEGEMITELKENESILVSYDVSVKHCKKTENCCGRQKVTAIEGKIVFGN